MINEFNMIFFVGSFTIATLISVVVAVQAKWRGYSFIVWLIAGSLGNVILLLVLLGMLPDEARRRLRKKEMEDLEKRLRERSQPTTELTTTSTVAARASRVVDRSLGDEVTAFPQRSIGDEPTRL